MIASTILINISKKVVLITHLIIKFTILQTGAQMQSSSKSGPWRKVCMTFHENFFGRGSLQYRTSYRQFHICCSSVIFYCLCLFIDFPLMASGMKKYSCSSSMHLLTMKYEETYAFPRLLRFGGHRYVGC